MPTNNAFTRKPLPHFREPAATYFATWRLHRDQAPLSAAERDVVANVLRHFDAVRYTLHAWVVMDDHLHVVVTPLGDTTIDTVVHSWKSYTPHLLRGAGAREPPIWQRGRADRVVFVDGELAQKVAYVCANPWRRWPELREYRWVWPVPEMRYCRVTWTHDSQG